MLNYLVSYIMNRIDKKILNLLISNPLITLEETIRERIIIGIFLKDLNLVGGRSIELKIRLDMTTQLSTDKILIEIPKEDRKNSKISSVQYIMHNDNVSTTIPSYGYTDTSNSRNAIEDLFSKTDGGTGIQMLTNIQLLGSKYVVIESPNISPNDVVDNILKFEVEYAENFEEIDGAYYPEMGTICIKCAKMFIHTELALSIDELLQSNPNISDRLIQTINSYEEFEQAYQNELDRLGKFSFLNDRKKMSELIGFSI